MTVNNPKRSFLICCTIIIVFGEILNECTNDSHRSTRHIIVTPVLNSTKTRFSGCPVCSVFSAHPIFLFSGLSDNLWSVKTVDDGKNWHWPEVLRFSETNIYNIAGISLARHLRRILIIFSIFHDISMIKIWTSWLLGRS